MKTVGIPRSMYYFEYGQLWKSFFEGLGTEVVLSPKTDEKILAEGIKCASSDLCLPVKTAFGHVKNLIERNPDYIFLPEIRKTNKNCFTCPKSIGLNSMLKNTFAGSMQKTVSPRLNGNSKKMLSDAAREMGFGSVQTKKALRAVEKGRKPENAEPQKREFKVALIGHSYMLGDNKLNMDMEERLKKLDVSFITPDTFRKKRISEFAENTGFKRPFWNSAQKSFGFTKYIADNKAADGVIFLSSFGCGTDALSTDFCREYLKQHGKIPSLTLSLDEHTAEAGLNTRLEAFRDCMEFRKMR
ncbi:MAG: 2-hydroxyacyl-CoA dehydratase [Oscillospiraceae bacterium]|nr:2-hydroxyacyl-CoA dehydratase [Oscillospiraceae bacterium]